jgi:Mitochondrial carrier protein
MCACVIHLHLPLSEQLLAIPLELISSTLVIRMCAYRSPLAGAYPQYLYSCDDPLECLLRIVTEGGWLGLFSGCWPFVWVYLPLLASRLGLSQLIT